MCSAVCVDPLEWIPVFITKVDRSIAPSTGILGNGWDSSQNQRTSRTNSIQSVEIANQRASESCTKRMEVIIRLPKFLMKYKCKAMYHSHVSTTYVVGENETAENFIEASKVKKKAFSAIFWNESMAQWLDCWIETDIKFKDDQPLKNWRQSKRVFASNFIPLWINLPKSDDQLQKVMKSLRNSGLICANGIATSLTDSGQQWDFPNGWASLQHMIIEGLANFGSEEATSMAKDIAFKWLKTNYITFKKTGRMHEKYNVDKCGESGYGGLYKPQTGFGWTNGVVLALLEEFGWLDHQKLECE